MRGSGTHRRHELVAHPGDQEAAKAALSVRYPQRGKASSGELTRRLDQTLEYLLDGHLGGDRQYGVADRLQRWAQPLRHRQHDSFAEVPRIWLWTQVAILVFVLAGMAIALTKLV